MCRLLLLLVRFTSSISFLSSAQTILIPPKFYLSIYLSLQLPSFLFSFYISLHLHPSSRSVLLLTYMHLNLVCGLYICVRVQTFFFPVFMPFTKKELNSIASFLPLSHFLHHGLGNTTSLVQSQVGLKMDILFLNLNASLKYTMCKKVSRRHMHTSRFLRNITKKMGFPVWVSSFLST